MTQNIYDNDDFFAGYAKLKRSEEGLAGAPEWPSMSAMLPDLSGLAVLDLGCGFGSFCRHAREKGAGSVVGVDVSEKMLARAVEASDPAIRYVRADLDAFTLEPNTFNVVYSSLAFHYLKNLDALLAEIAKALVPGGRLVFSVEHPMFTAPVTPDWAATAEGRKAWPVDSYLKEGPRTTNWLAPGVIKQHRTMATYLNLLWRNQLAVFHVEEWGPTDAQIADWPALADERERPTFLLLGATRD
ncbi:MAG TPA: class I SAM-dependent methyltransferase [Rhizomicrobium sp.]|nr:class I SAM-dependent methyltransferase [Rhizomicrobium sp.]